AARVVCGAALAWWVVGCAAQQAIVRERALGPGPDPTSEYGDHTFVQASRGRHCLYPREEDGRVRWYLDGVPGPFTRRLSYFHPMWDASGHRIRYLADEGTRARPSVRLFVNLEPGPAFEEIEGYGCSPDGRRISYFARRGARWMPVIDGVIGPEYDEKGFVVFSRDSARVAWFGRRGEAWFATFDGREQGPYDAIDRVMYGADGRRTICFATVEGVPHLLVNGEELCEGSYSFFTRYPPQGDREVLAVNRPGEMQVVVAGELGPVYPHFGPTAGGDIAFTFSPDGRRFGYVAYRDGRAFAVVDDQEGPPFDDAAPPEFSLDSLRCAYVAMRADMWMVVLDGQPQPEYDAVGSVVFSGDSRHVAYRATRRHRQLVVVDGALGPQYDQIGSYIVANPAGTGFAYRARQGDRWRVVVDGAEGPPYDEIEPHDGPCFSPDGRHLAYRARKGDRWVFVVDGREGSEYESITTDWDNPFSPDSRHWAYVGTRDGLAYAVIDGREGPPYGRIEGIGFSGDGNHFAYCAARMRLSQRPVRVWGEGSEPTLRRIGIPEHHVVVDGVEGPRYDELLGYGLSISRRGTVRYLAVRDGVLYRVRHTPVAPEG
ncbi:MAG: hypothetical protein FJX74_20940, partial [Armatimonadetes bacterium]|nr:hypothetical protein [Armatimonadota bacterium]